MLLRSARSQCSFSPVNGPLRVTSLIPQPGTGRRYQDPTHILLGLQIGNRIKAREYTLRLVAVLHCIRALKLCSCRQSGSQTGPGNHSNVLVWAPTFRLQVGAIYSLESPKYKRGLYELLSTHLVNPKGIEPLYGLWEEPCNSLPVIDCSS